jgi:hypothetical protein
MYGVRRNALEETIRQSHDAEHRNLIRPRLSTKSRVFDGGGRTATRSAVSATPALSTASNSVTHAAAHPYASAREHSRTRRMS